MNARWVRRCLWVLGFGCLWLPVFDDPPLRSGACVQDVGTDRAVVAMITAAAEVRSLRWFDAAGGPHEVAGPGPRRRHEFEIGGLQAGHEYRYEVVDAAGERVDGGSIRTAPADDAAEVTFAVFGDSGDQPWWTWLQRAPAVRPFVLAGLLPPQGVVRAIGDRVARARPDFVVHVGDIVYPWGHDGHYAAGFFLPFADALRQTPFYAALGNHDVLDDQGRQALGNFRLPVGETTGDERCYSFAWGAVRVICVDFTWRDARDNVGPGHPSFEFLQRELATRTEPWVIVASHYPLYSASRQGNRADLLDKVQPLLEQYGVDLYLCGHDHTYQRFGDGDEVVEVVSGGGGKDLYPVNRHPRVRVAQSLHHWCMVHVKGTRLRLQASTVDGAVIDTVVIDHAAGPRLDRIRAANPGRAARIGG